MQALATGSPSCPSLRKFYARRSNNRGVVISLARNELTRDMFMACVRGAAPGGRQMPGTGWRAESQATHLMALVKWSYRNRL